MNPTNAQMRRAIGAAIVVMLAFALAACSRTSKTLSPAVEANPTWTGTVSHLFADRSSGTKPTGCTSCHHAGTTLPDWTDYDTVYAYRNNIYTRLSTSGDQMRGFAGPGEADLICNWILAGAPK